MLWTYEAQNLQRLTNECLIQLSSKVHATNFSVSPLMRLNPCTFRWTILRVAADNTRLTQSSVSVREFLACRRWVQRAIALHLSVWVSEWVSVSVCVCVRERELCPHLRQCGSAYAECSARRSPNPTVSASRFGDFSTPSADVEHRFALPTRPQSLPTLADCTRATARAGSRWGRKVGTRPDKTNRRHGQRDWIMTEN